MNYDLLIKNATVIDGSGAPGYPADVAVTGDKISAIIPNPEAGSNIEAATVLDGTGKVLSPGFIDPHTHDDTIVVRGPEMMPKISQGITTVIAGHCGISAVTAVIKGDLPDPMNLLGDKDDYAYPTVDAYREALMRARPAVNVGTLIGHTTLRNNCMNDLFRPASKAEIAIMRSQLREGLEQGAMGLSTGLAYATAFQAPLEEVLSLAEELTAVDGLYLTHVRSEYEPILDSLDEAIRVGRHAGVATHISHFKCAGVRNWGRTVETLAFFDKAREDQDVTADCYPYAAGSTTLDLSQITSDYRIDISWSVPHPEMAGRPLAEIAEEWGLSLLEAGRRLLPAGAVYHQMDEQDVRRVLRHPAVMIGSDGLPYDPLPHPRLWGSFPRVLGHYCRDEKLFSLPEAVRKMTGMTAARFRLDRRGLVREGYYADLTLFDPATVLDKAVYGKPGVPAAGIEAVVVNGVLAYQGGKLTGRREGRFLTRQA